MYFWEQMKVLILAYDFPPYVSVGGLRPYGWFKYFKEFGIEPIVITRQWGNHYGNHLDYIAPGESEEEIVEENELGTIIRSPYHPNFSNRLLLNHGERKWRLIRKAYSGFSEVAQFYFPMGTKIELFHTAHRYLSQNKVDFIVATGDPFVLFHYAKKLGIQFSIPWVADYRDPWSHHKENSRPWWANLWFRSIEKRTVNNAIQAITVSSFVQQKINGLLPNLPMAIIPNGYDPEAISNIKQVPQNKEVLKMAFVGTIYNWHPLELFIENVNEFILKNNCALEINFYGTNKTDWIDSFISSTYPHLKDSIHAYNKRPNQELLQVLAENHVMLLFNYYSYLGTKIFDYLAIRRKIILCFEEDQEADNLKSKFYTIKELDSENNQLQAELIRKTNSGIVVKDQSHLQSVLKDLADEHSLTGNIACNSQGVEQYSRKIQVERMSILLKELQKSSQNE